MQRLRFELNGIYSAYFLATDFGDIDWNHFLYKSSLPDTMPYTADILLANDITSTTTVKIGEKKFIYPLSIEQYKAIVDGTVNGWVKFKFLTNNASYKAYIDLFVVALYKLTAQGAYELIKKHTVTTSLETLSTTGDTKTIPFFFDVESSELRDNERLVVEVTVYGKVDSGGTGTYYLVCTINEDDLYINIPVV